jgi:FkbM family methyltransferase
MFNLVRRIIYTPKINFILRHVLKLFNGCLPKNLKIPVSGKIRIRLNDHNSFVMMTNQTNYLTKQVFWGGIQNYEYQVVRIFKNIITDLDCFMDVGSNLGYYSLIAATLNPKIDVYAFEPLPSAFLFLQNNIRLNKLNNVKAYQLALSNKEGEIDFYATKMPKALYLKHHISGTSNLATPKDSYSEIIKVNSQTLDHFADENLLKKVDLIKLDTEGTENVVLEGAKGIIERDKPIVISELLPGKIEHELEMFYKNQDYLFFASKNDGLIQINSLIGYSEKKEDLFFVHESKKRKLNPFLFT